MRFSWRFLRRDAWCALISYCPPLQVPASPVHCRNNQRLIQLLSMLHLVAVIQGEDVKPLIALPNSQRALMPVVTIHLFSAVPKGSRRAPPTPLQLWWFSRCLMHSQRSSGEFCRRRGIQPLTHQDNRQVVAHLKLRCLDQLTFHSWIM